MEILTKNRIWLKNGAWHKDSICYLKNYTKFVPNLCQGPLVDPFQNRNTNQTSGTLMPFGSLVVFQNTS